MQSAIYKWTGKYFDINHYIETSAVKRIDHFFVGPIHFLAVANYKSDGIILTHFPIYSLI